MYNTISLILINFQVSNSPAVPVLLKSHNNSNSQITNGISEAHGNEETTFMKMPGTIIRTINEILDELLTIRKKQEQEARQAAIADQWKNIAAMYDRVLFVCFAVCIVGITIWFLTTRERPM